MSDCRSHEQAHILRNLEESIDALYDQQGEQQQPISRDVGHCLSLAMLNNGEVYAPIEVPFPAEGQVIGRTVQGQPVFELPFGFKTLLGTQGKQILPAFTRPEEVDNGPETAHRAVSLEYYLSQALMSDQVEGVTLNPWGKSCHLDKEVIAAVFQEYACLRQARGFTLTCETMDITQSSAQCIVNAANRRLMGGGGVDGAIHRAAGPELLEACKALGGCPTGQAKLTRGYRLHADYVIHTVGPVYTGDGEDARLLRSCYWNCLELARAHNLRSITFPAISTGVYGYPLEEAAQLAVTTVLDWLDATPNSGMHIQFVSLRPEVTALYEATLERIQSQQAQTSDAPQPQTQPGRLERALQLCARCYEAAPDAAPDAILAPLAAMQAMSEMNRSTDLLIAALLQEPLAEGLLSSLEVYLEFGAEVISLANPPMTYGTSAWYPKMICRLTQLGQSDPDRKLVALADTVAKLRTLCARALPAPEVYWSTQEVSKAWQGWYYSTLTDYLALFQGYAGIDRIYWEMVGCYKDLFVTYQVDEGRGLLYQLGCSGEGYLLEKGKPTWIALDAPPTAPLPTLTRREAEQLEERWNQSFWALLQQDAADGDYLLLDTPQQRLRVQLQNGALTYTQYTQSDAGAYTPTWQHRLSQADTRTFLRELRLRYPLRYQLGDLLRKSFSGDDGGGVASFQIFCSEIGVGCLEWSGCTLLNPAG